MTVGEMIKLAEENILKFDSNVDSKINYKVSRLTVYGNDEDDLHSVEIYLQTYCDTIPMARLYKNFDESDNIKYKGMSVEQSEMYLCKKDEISEMHTKGTNFALNPTGNSIDKIISLEEVLGLVKEKLSNSVVYDVESIHLGYSGDAVTDTDYYKNNNSTPIYNIVLNSTSHNISISVDALTGDMNIERRENNR